VSRGAPIRAWIGALGTVAHVAMLLVFITLETVWRVLTGRQPNPPA
jgi:hypothetical protein